ncbi:ATP-grasp domain-containing protein [Kamptonema cortianum]|nr:ATP-grasp domain-containing protein [Geitlerinema splendidum]MDK3160397.1 ATP-grasp domain-containing protein [Kamptonema cortianum]
MELSRFEFDIGFLGGGQLARMSIMAAQRMGLKCLSLDSSKGTPAGEIAPAIVGKLDDERAVEQVLRRCNKVTLENEFIPADVIRDALRASGRGEGCVLPGPDCLETIQDKLTQRRAYESAKVPSPKAVPIDQAKAKIGFPMVLKSRFGGYDGKGTRYARTEAEFEEHRDLWSKGGWMAEEFVPFQRELAVMVFRPAPGSPGVAGCFPTMETVQKNHVCDLVFPADVDASQIALDAVKAVRGYGLFGVELFETESGEFLVNEIAPRPHNTGHYTLDWGGVSQFEQHVRLVMGMPPLPPVGQPTCMANLLGQEPSGDWTQAMMSAIEKIPETRFHWYGKLEARAGRKMGHINVVGNDCVRLAQASRDEFMMRWGLN